jgi:GTP cyclohydrolase I
MEGPMSVEVESTVGIADPLADIQASWDKRGVDIDRVGVTRIRYPLWVNDRDRQRQHTIATVNMFVNLPHQFRGTHMSRFLQVLNECRDVSTARLSELAETLRERLDAEAAQVEMEFPFFVTKRAPVSGAEGLMEFTCAIESSVGPGERDDTVVRVSVPVTTLCPCSREISERGAHNQRGVGDLRVRTSGFVWFEELIDLIEASASCALYPVLKRPDEKWVTERAYDNPRFVEDLLREIAVHMRAHPRVRWYRIEVENQESIHAHNAYATVERWK